MHMELNVQQTMEILLIFRIIGLLIVKIYLSLLFWKEKGQDFNIAHITLKCVPPSN